MPTEKNRAGAGKYLTNFGIPKTRLYTIVYLFKSKNKMNSYSELICINFEIRHLYQCEIGTG